MSVTNIYAMSQAVLKDFSYCLLAVTCYCCCTEDPSLRFGSTCETFFPLHSSCCIQALRKVADHFCIALLFVVFNQLHVWQYCFVLVIFLILDCIPGFTKANTLNN